MKVKVAVNGYGTIGKRVADAVAIQPDMTLVGVAKTRPSFEARASRSNGGTRSSWPAEARRPSSTAAGLPVAGTVDEMIAAADVVVDCSPEKVGRENAQEVPGGRRPRDLPGRGEVRRRRGLVQRARQLRPGPRPPSTVRVVSCNTTGLARAAASWSPTGGSPHWEATIVRRGADPGGDRPRPHQRDHPEVPTPVPPRTGRPDDLPELPIATTAVVVPTTLMHVHVNHVRLDAPARRRGGVLDRVPRHPPVPSLRSVGARRRHPAGDGVRPRPGDIGAPDMMENVLWEAGLRVDGPDLVLLPGDPPGVDRRPGEHRRDPSDVRPRRGRPDVHRDHRPGARDPAPLIGPGRRRDERRRGERRPGHVREAGSFQSYRAPEAKNDSVSHRAAAGFGQNGAPVAVPIAAVTWARNNGEIR